MNWTPTPDRGWSWIRRRFFNVHWLVGKLPIPRDWQLRLQRTHLSRGLEKALRAARAPNSDSLEEDVYNDWSFEFDLIDDERAEIFSRRLLNRARKLMLATPSAYAPGSIELTEDYERTHTTEQIVLSLHGAQKVRQAIREEEKWRAEGRARLIPWITAVTGLLGTATGLIATWQKWGGGP
jgi:hypothetical protein